MNKARKFQQFEILDVAWDESLGGTNLDLLLMEHFAAEFEEKHKKDIRTHPKVRADVAGGGRRTGGFGCSGYISEGEGRKWEKMEGEEEEEGV